jgi:hypothetical protein
MAEIFLPGLTCSYSKPKILADDLSSIVWQLRATISVEDDPGATYKLVDDSKDILKAIATQEELQRNAEADRLLAEGAHNANANVDPPRENNATAEPETPVCDTCKAPIGVVNDLEQCRQILAAVTEEGKSLRKELVSKLKKGPKWEKAAKIYDELSTLEKNSMDSYISQGKEEEALSCEKKYLFYRHEYVKMILELNQSERNEQVLRIAEATYKRREELKLGTETKWSHDQYCLLLRLLRKFEVAKAEHRRVYAEFIESAPTRALDNGFKLGEIFVVEGKIEPAAHKFYQMYQEGKTKLGLSSSLVLKFALRSVEAEEVRGTKCDLDKVEDILKEMWEARNLAGPSAEVVALGHQYGLFLIKVGKYAEVAPVFEAVRSYRITRYGVKSKEVFETTNSLFQCYVQIQDWKAAERIGRAIVKYRESDSKTNAEAMSAYHALGNVLAAGNERRTAEIYLRKSWEGRKALRTFDLPALQNGCDCANILELPYNTINVFTEVWAHSKDRLATSDLESTERLILLSYGNQLATILEEQKVRDKYETASNIYKEVLARGQGILPPEDALFYAFKYGKCRYLMRNYSGAIQELGQLWDKGKDEWGSGLENYLEAGYYYFLSLKKQDKRHNKIRAKEVIRDVIRLARDKYGEGSKEYTRYDNALQSY